MTAIWSTISAPAVSRPTTSHAAVPIRTRNGTPAAGWSEIRSGTEAAPPTAAATATIAEQTLTTTCTALGGAALAPKQPHDGVPARRAATTTRANAR